MLIGSQLKNAQLEVFANIAALPTTNNVRGRIVYVVDQAQLYLYDGAPGGAPSNWKPINTAEDSLAILATQSALITGGSGAAAPTRTVNNIEELQDDIIDGTQTMFANKKTPQEMSYTWNLNGNFVGAQTFPDGSFVLPFDAEITGVSASVYSNGSAGTTQFYIYHSASITASWTNLFDVNGVFTAGDDLLQHMYINNVIAATGVVQEDAVTSGKTNTSGGDILPELKAAALTLEEGHRLSLGVVSAATGVQDLTVTVFFRRRNNG